MFYTSSVPSECVKDLPENPNMVCSSQNIKTWTWRRWSSVQTLDGSGQRFQWQNGGVKEIGKCCLEGMYSGWC